jgi:hypothetical protein
VVDQLMALLHQVDPSELGTKEKRALIRFLHKVLVTEPLAGVGVDDPSV